MTSHCINQDCSERPYLHSSILHSLPYYLHTLEASLNSGKISDMMKYQELYIALVIWEICMHNVKLQPSRRSWEFAQGKLEKWKEWLTFTTSYIQWPDIQGNGKRRVLRREKVEVAIRDGSPGQSFSENVCWGYLFNKSGKWSTIRISKTMKLSYPFHRARVKQECRNLASLITKISVVIPANVNTKNVSGVGERF